MARSDRGRSTIASSGLLSSRRQKTRRERERRGQRILMIAGALAIVLVLSIPTVGYYITFVRPLQQVVMQVGNISYNVGDYAKFLRAAAIQAGGIDNVPPEFMTNAPFEILFDLQKVAILRAMGEELDLSVSVREVDNELRQVILGRSTPSEENEENVQRLEETYQKRLQDRLDVLKMSEKEYRTMIHSSLLLEKHREILKNSVPLTADQIHLHGIKVAETSEAEEVIRRLDSGEEDFATVAQDVSTHTTGPSGGDLGWYTRRAKIGNEEIVDIMFDDYEIGQITAPIIVQEAAWILKSVERDQDRDLNSSQRSLLEYNAVTDWFSLQLEQQNVHTSFTSETYEFVMEYLRLDRTIR